MHALERVRLEHVKPSRRYFAEKAPQYGLLAYRRKILGSACGTSAPPVGGGAKSWRVTRAGSGTYDLGTSLTPCARERTTATRVPTSTKPARCSTAEFIIRKQPEDRARPIDLASLVPWIR